MADGIQYGHLRGSAGPAVADGIQCGHLECPAGPAVADGIQSSGSLFHQQFPYIFSAKELVVEVYITAILGGNSGRHRISHLNFKHMSHMSIVCLLFKSKMASDVNAHVMIIYIDMYTCVRDMYFFFLILMTCIHVSADTCQTIRPPQVEVDDA